MTERKWMKKALLLGLSFFLAILLVKPIGVSTQFSVAAGLINRICDVDVIWEEDSADYGYASSNEYYNEDGGKLASKIANPINYDFIFVLAIPLGGWLYYLINRSRRDVLDTYESCEVSKSRVWNQYGIAFLSGFILLFGARMADGCTSGHMMSGIMQGSVSGYIFAISVFAVAIPVAILTDRRIQQ